MKIKILDYKDNQNYPSLHFIRDKMAIIRTLESFDDVQEISKFLIDFDINLLQEKILQVNENYFKLLV